MNRLRYIFETKIAKVISSLLAVLFLASIYFCFDFYKTQVNKIRGYHLVFKGDKALKKQDLQNAINYYEKGIKLHPGHYRAMYNLANIYVVYEDYYQALKNYEKALRVHPDYEVARIDYAIILSQSYRPDEAIEQYKLILANRPKFIKIPFIVDSKKAHYHNLGVAYYNMGLAYRTKSLLAGLDYMSSREYLEKATESYEEAAGILKSYNSNYNLGLIHQLLKNKHQAGYYYCKAIEQEPMEYEAHFNLAVLLNDLKYYKEAKEEFQKAGLLLDSKGDSGKTRYIYDVLLSVNQKIAMDADSEYFKKLVREEEMSDNSKYKAGKLIIDLKPDKKKDELYESFKTCANKEHFMGAHH